MKSKMYKAFCYIAGRLQANTQPLPRALEEEALIQNSCKKLDCYGAMAPRNGNLEKTNYLNAMALIITLPLCLTGCMGIYEGGFECPAGVGVGCKSISEVNTMVDRGELPKGERPKGELPKIQVEPPTPVNHEIWYAPRFKHQKNFPAHSGNISSSKKEDMKKVDLSDV